MSFDQRDQLWDCVFGTYYDAYYQEFLADDLVTVWRNLDELTKIIVAITTTGSVVSGWALWKSPYGHIVWAIIAGIAAILAIIHSTLGVPAKLKDWGDVKQIFTSLRIDLETFRHRMEIDYNFPLDEFGLKFDKYRTRYREGMQRIQNDRFRTIKRGDKIQSRLNKLIKDIIIEEKGE